MGRFFPDFSTHYSFPADQQWDYVDTMADSSYCKSCNAYEVLNRMSPDDDIEGVEKGILFCNDLERDFGTRDCYRKLLLATLEHASITGYLEWPEFNSTLRELARRGLEMCKKINLSGDHIHTRLLKLGAQIEVDKRAAASMMGKSVEIFLSFSKNDPEGALQELWELADYSDERAFYNQHMAASIYQITFVYLERGLRWLAAYPKTIKADRVRYLEIAFILEEAYYYTSQYSKYDSFVKSLGKKEMPTRCGERAVRQYMIALRTGAELPPFPDQDEDELYESCDEMRGDPPLRWIELRKAAIAESGYCQDVKDFVSDQETFRFYYAACFVIQECPTEARVEFAKWRANFSGDPNWLAWQWLERAKIALLEGNPALCQKFAECGLAEPMTAPFVMWERTKKDLTEIRTLRACHACAKMYRPLGVCAACLDAFYCNDDCMAKDWYPNHNKVCSPEHAS